MTTSSGTRRIWAQLGLAACVALLAGCSASPEVDPPSDRLDAGPTAEGCPCDVVKREGHLPYVRIDLACACKENRCIRWGDTPQCGSTKVYDWTLNTYGGCNLVSVSHSNFNTALEQLFSATTHELLGAWGYSDNVDYVQCGDQEGERMFGQFPPEDCQITKSEPLCL